MRSRLRAALLCLLAVCLLLPLAACAAGKSNPDRYDGFTVRTEKTREAETGQSAEEPFGAGTTQTGEIRDYVLNKSSMKFHDPGCKGVDDIAEKNRWDYRGTRKSVLDMGYTPCGICDP